MKGLARAPRDAEGRAPRVRRLSSNGTHPAYLLRYPSGEAKKARCFASPGAAASVERRLARLPAGILPPLLGRSGNAILLAFVEGERLDRRLRADRAPRTRRWARAAGLLLARLHAVRGFARTAPEPARYARKLRRDLAALVRAGLLDRAQAAPLRALGAPPSARAGLTHGDLVPGNLLVGPRGRLLAIDEERLAPRPFAFDLARTVARWPLDAAHERAFLGGYRAGGGDPAGYRAHRRFWLAVAFATSAAYRLAGGRGRSPRAALRGLRGLAAGEPGSTRPRRRE